MMRRGPFGFGGGPRMFGRGDLKYALLGLLEEHPKHGYEMIKDLEDRSGGFYSPSAGAIYPTLQLLEDRSWVSAEMVEGKKVYTITDSGRTALSEYKERAQSGPFGNRGFGPGPGFGPGFGPDFGPGFGPGQHGPHGPHGHHREERGERGGRGRGNWGPWGPFGGGNWEEAGPELRALSHEGREIARLMREAVIISARDTTRLKELRGIVERVRSELLTFVSQRPNGQGSQGGQSSQSDQPDQPDNGEGPVEQL